MSTEDEQKASSDSEATKAAEAETGADSESEPKKVLVSDNEGDKDSPAAADEEPLTAEALALSEDFAPAYEGVVEDFVEVLNKPHESRAGLAKALLELHDKTQTRASEAMEAEWERVQEDWIKEVEADPEIGGSKQEAVLGSINEFVKEVMGNQADAVFEAMAVTSAGNNPAIIRLLAKAAAVVKEAEPVDGRKPPAEDKRDLATRMFPNM